MKQTITSPEYRLQKSVDSIRMQERVQLSRLVKAHVAIVNQYVGVIAGILQIDTE
jgi:hypothetical protein